MPKSITRGSLAVRMMLAGFRSRCASPARWMSASASASPAASTSSVDGGNGPKDRTASRRVTPGRYAVTSHGAAASASASSTGAVKVPVTVRAAATSRRNRTRNSWSPARRSSTTLIATGRPAGERPRYTTPMPPVPSRATSSYSPIRVGSVFSSGCTGSSLPALYPAADREESRLATPGRQWTVASADDTVASASARPGSVDRSSARQAM